MNGFFSDDKNLVILAVLALGLAIISKDNINPESVNLLTGVFSGLFGIAVGRVSK